MCRIIERNKWPEVHAIEAWTKAQTNNSIPDFSTIPTVCHCPEKRCEDQWKNIRFYYEDFMGFVETDVASRGKNVQGSCVIGFLLEQWARADLTVNNRLHQCRPLNDNDVIPYESIIIVVRVPVVPLPRCQKIMQNVFVPEGVRHRKAMTMAETETDKLEVIMQSEAQVYEMDMASGIMDLGKVHPSYRYLILYANNVHLQQKRDTQIAQNKPPPTYQCFGCLATGEHFRHQCPFDIDGHHEIGYTPIDKLRAPTGITRDLLRIAEPHERHMADTLAKWMPDGTILLLRRI